MATFQIIGIVVVALLGLAIFYCIYDISFRKDKKKRKTRSTKTESNKQTK